MIKSLLIGLSLVSFVELWAQINFSEYFENKTMRVDYFHTGDLNEEIYSIDEVIEEPFWGGSMKNLIDKFNYGAYKFFVFDSASNELIYSRGYATLFSEWRTIEEAKYTRKSFSETITFPFPRKTVRLEFHSWSRRRELSKQFEYYINPDCYFISKERKKEYSVIKPHYSGDHNVKTDVVLIPEGYTDKEMEKFKKDCDKFIGYFFNCSPFKENKDKFNFWAVLAPSKESGTDIPGEGIWKNTIINSSFYTFDSERYLMTKDNKSLRDVASNAPYDQIYIIVNTSKYGGGAIYNHYAVCVSDNNFNEYIFTHEFGHSFCYLADEYEGDVSYQEFYPLDVEPAEANITTLINFEKKWSHLVHDDVPIPTPNDIKYSGKVGVFEGGGYSSKNIYRPMLDCSMRSISVDNFCDVCKNAIIEMIKFYSE